MDLWSGCVLYTFSSVCMIMVVAVIIHCGWSRARHRKKQEAVVEAIARYLADNSHELNIEDMTN
jgi:hypothetical protein